MLKIRTPAYIHSSVTYLDCLKYEFSTLERFLIQAHEKGVLNNPLERLKIVTAAQVSSIHTGVMNNGIRTPLNPIIGETTCQATDQGSTLYTEQTSHHPPISHFQLIGPASVPFILSGYVEFKVTLDYGFSSANCTMPGYLQLTLPNGDVMEFTTKAVKVTGLFFKEKRVNIVNQMTVKDITHNLRSVIQFDSQKKKRTGYWTSYITGVDKPNKETGVIDARSDLLTVEITE